MILKTTYSTCYISVFLVGSQIFPGLLFYPELFIALNRTSVVFGRKLLFIDINAECKLISVGLCRKSMFHLYSWEDTEQLN